ncbi:ferredoxin [Actinomadura sp. NBRC 104425]|uniref:PDR/VanB family oxidoreductase n=1 Tax=Actinomadura sp. NBRC 104425 TaxID=3032204 RepID=UPI0024A2432C|nr:PDR/VanB family oxidoreductase [Actinomadura sp. NBRC 104425]GLZ12732.1 ferredoxin [Actinomadura sp. NBRC 104425]
MPVQDPPRTEVDLDVVLDGRRPVAEDVVLLTLRRADGGPFPAWEPGAHVDLVLAPGLVRQYSLCGDPADRSVLQVAVLRERDGRGGSEHVHRRLAEGDRLAVRGPRNHFPLVAADRYLFIAGGIGITPIMPMLAAAHASGADWRLVYGGRTRASMAFRTDLEHAYGDRVSVRPQDETGLLDLDALLGAPDERTQVYCCGPEPLLAAVEERCAAWPPGALHVERFTPKDDTGPRGSFEVELARSGRTLTVPPGKSILQVVEEAGVQVLSSCREGTCGTCETEVLGGEPDHRDSVLTDEERRSGEIMMICVSRARGARLTLDL